MKHFTSLLSQPVPIIDGREVRGTIVDGYSISMNISDEWEGCDWDSHRLDNGMVLQCSSYFYEYAYRPVWKSS